MNLLLAASRQFRPEEECAALGVRKLFEAALGQKVQWILYDRNPDLRELHAPKTHRSPLYSNSFHHQNLDVFSGVVVLGPTDWSGHEMELLYGVLAKSKVPAFGCALEAKESSPPLEGLTLDCLKRSFVFLSTTDTFTQAWLGDHQLRAERLVDPILFAQSVSRPAEGRAPLAFVLEDPLTRGSQITEAEVWRVSKQIDSLRAQFPLRILCPTVQDFMRFSKLYPDEVRYSFEARDYLDALSGCVGLITHRKDWALLANSCGTKSLLWKDEGQDTLHSPGVTKIPLESITPNTLHSSLSAELPSWMESQRQAWITALTPYVANHRKGA